jgi:GT2 family glycosyltransferase
MLQAAPTPASRSNPATQRGALSSSNFSVSIVLFDSDLDLFRQTIAALAIAIRHASAAGLVRDVRVAIIDNNGAQGVRLDEGWNPGDATVAIVPLAHWRRISGQGNVGFGRGHNLALLDRTMTGDFHLVLNPDAPLAEDALTVALQWMAQTPDSALVAPNARSDDNVPLFLCKRYPDAFTLFLRAAAPRRVRRWFAGRLARYELHDIVGTDGEKQARDVPLASGCCMVLRTAALEAIVGVGGFDPSFFVYFEDYDLSLRIARSGRWHIDYLPQMKLIHYGGHAAKKNWSHVRMFAAGAIRFFNRHGWKLV